MNKKRVHHIDCNHSWLQVPGSDLPELGLQGGVFDYAGVAEGNLYLSEDEEMDVYLRAAEAAGWTVILIERHYADRCDYIRNLPFLNENAEEANFLRILNTPET